MLWKMSCGGADEIPHTHGDSAEHGFELESHIHGGIPIFDLDGGFVQLMSSDGRCKVEVPPDNPKAILTAWPDQHTPAEMPSPASRN